MGALEAFLVSLINKRALRTAIISLMGLFFVWTTLNWQIKEIGISDLLSGQKGNVESVAYYLAENIQEGDFIADAREDGPTFRYYASYQYGMEKHHYDITKGPFDRMFVIVKPSSGQTIEENIETRGSALLDKYNPDEVELVYDELGFQIFLMELHP